MVERIKRSNGFPEINAPLILVAEPNKLNRKLTCDLLKSKGYKVLEVGSPRMIVEAARQNKPGLVFIGASLPEDETNRVLKKFRQDNKLDHIPVIAVTKEMIGNNFDAYSSDHDRILSMPVSTLSIIRMIDVTLSRVRKNALKS